MKTINFLTSHFLPEISPCTNRVLPLIIELQKRYKVNVICLTEKGVFQEKEKVSYNDNVDIYYINQKDFNGKNFFIRGWYELLYAIKLIKLSNSVNCDEIIVTSPYMFSIPIASYGIKGKKILDNRDLVWEYLDENSFLKSSIKKMLKFVMKFSMKRFNHVMVTNENEAKILSDHYGLKGVHIILNGIAKDRYARLSTLEKNSDAPFTVTYVGNIGLAQNLRVLIDAAKELPGVQFLVIGDGVDMSSIRERAEKNQLKNVVFTGKIEWDELADYYKNTAVLYTQLEEKYSAAMPSKLYEYASTGRSIIYGGIGQATSFMEKLESAIVVKPNNVTELVHAIIQMRDNTLTISEKNRLLIKENYLREKSAQKVVQLAGELLLE